jgi:small Trp-rich protein
VHYSLGSPACQNIVRTQRVIHAQAVAFAGVITMWFVVIGLVLVLLKVAAVAPVALWSWWLVLTPFGLAALWWHWADSVGLTQRKAMRQMDEKQAARRKKTMESLGQADPTRRK